MTPSPACGVIGYRGADVGTSRSLPTGEITEMLESGVDTREIVRRMVATGDWSEGGAVDFVSFLAHGPDASPRPVRVDTPVVVVTSGLEYRTLGLVAQPSLE
jgi:hypothetical protein